MITELLTLKEQIKMYHWQTKSHSQHMALDRIYGDMQDSIDEFVEIFIGKQGRFDPENNIGISLNTDIKNLNDFVEKNITYLSTDLIKNLDTQKDADLLNIAADMLGHINQLKYLLTLS